MFTDVWSDGIISNMYQTKRQIKVDLSLCCALVWVLKIVDISLKICHRNKLQSD